MSSNVENRPFKFGANDRREFIVQDTEVEIRCENDASGNVIYLGFAKAGTAETEAKWQISFHVWDANNALTSRTWAENASAIPSTNYEFAWSNRAGYTYS